MNISVGRFPLCHLEGRDPEAPDVRDTVVPDLLDHLGGHPERGSCNQEIIGLAETPEC